MKRSLLILGMCFVVAPCFAQTATLNGVVTDISDAVVAGARVQVTNLETGLRRQAETNETGAYTFNLLPVGRYKIAVSKSGFGTSERPDLNLDVDQVARLDFKLKPGALVESVEVSAAATLLDTETSTVGQVIANKTIVE